MRIQRAPTRTDAPCFVMSSLAHMHAYALNTDARNSIFNDVSRDQTNIQTTNYNVYINRFSAPEPGPAVSRSADACPSLQAPRSETSFQDIVLLPTFRSVASSVRHPAAQLIDEILQSLMASDIWRDLKEDLTTLQQALDLTGLAITACLRTPLGQILANTIRKETDQCLGVLRELLTAIVTYQRYINSPWGQMWGSGCQSGEGGIWRKKLIACRKSLCECLHVLDS